MCSGGEPSVRAVSMRRPASALRRTARLACAQTGEGSQAFAKTSPTLKEGVFLSLLEL